MSQRIKVLLILAILVAIGAGLYFGLVKKSEPEQPPEQVDEQQLFNIVIPEDFDEYQRARVEEKLTDLKELYQQNPKETNFWIGLGNLRSLVGDYPGAIVAYQKCLEINPGEFVAMINIADIAEKNLQDFAKAEEYYKRAIDSFFTNPDFYSRLARLYYLKMNRPEEAEKTYLEGLEKTENHPDLLVGLIYLYDQRGREADKIKYIKLLLELYPDSQLYQQQFSKYLK